MRPLQPGVPTVDDMAAEPLTVAPLSDGNLAAHLAILVDVMDATTVQRAQNSQG